MEFKTIDFKELENISDDKNLILVAIKPENKEELIKEMNEFLHNDNAMDENTNVIDLKIINNIPHDHSFKNVTNMLVEFDNGNLYPLKRLKMGTMFKWVSDFIGFYEEF